MSLIRRAILALVLIAGLAPASSLAQVPAPVPALPDTERRTSYSLTASTCACTVNMALYGDSTDYQNWVEVWLSGVRVNYNDATFGWTITSPTGSLASIARPVTDGVLTFNSVQTGTVQSVGDPGDPRRERKLQTSPMPCARKMIHPSTTRWKVTKPAQPSRRFEPAPECVLADQAHPVKGSPDHKRPRGAVPQPAEHHRDHQIAVGEQP